MTNQEAFDKMMSHLRSLQGASMDCDGDCVYNGTKCAIGVLMTAGEQARYGKYAGSVRGLVVQMRTDGHTSMLHSLDKDLLSAMQQLHDNLDNWSEADGFDALGEDSARGIAKCAGLVYTAPKNRSKT